MSTLSVKKKKKKKSQEEETTGRARIIIHTLQRSLLVVYVDFANSFLLFVPWGVR